MQHNRHYPWLALLAACTLVFTLAACGVSTPPPEPEEAAPTTPAQPPEEAAMTDDEDDDHAHDEDDDHAHDEDDDHAHDEETASITSLVAALTPIEGGETLNVVATTTIVGDVVAQVGGDNIALTTLMPVGADPHSFEPTPQEVGTVADADVVFVNGFALEESLLDVIENSGIDPERIIPVSIGIDTIEFGEDEHAHEDDDHAHEDDEHTHEDDDHAHEDEEHSHEHSGVDPHAWMSPDNVIVWSENIAAVLSALDPDNGATYADNAAAYTSALEELDEWIVDQLAQIPEANRKLVTDHTAFGYYADEYGLEQVGAVVPAYSTLAETSAQELAALQEEITELGVPAIFVGTTVNPDLAEQIAADMGIELLPVYTGSLSEADGPATTYIDMMRYNTGQFVSGLSE